MFNRKVIKARAKEALRTTYWQTFGILLLIQVISSAAGMFFTLPTQVANTAVMRLVTMSTPSSLIIAPVFLLMLLLNIAISIFFLSPLALGGNKFLLDAAKKGFTDIGAIGYSFRSNYKNIVKVTFMKKLILAAFGIVPAILLLGVYIDYSISLYNGTDAYAVAASSGISDTLFVFLPLIAYALLIPAIIKTYDYYLVEYILADDASITWREALSKSKQLMRGNRWAAFVMNLSFFGWLLLGLCACGIGVIFVLPYISAADAQLYLELSGQSNVETFSENTENI